MSITLAAGFPTGSSGASQPTACTIACTVANVGDLLVVLMTAGINAGIAVSSITDSNSRVTWQSSATVTYTNPGPGAGSGDRDEIWYGVSTSTGSTTITVNYSTAPSGSNFQIADVIELHDSNAGNVWSVVTSGHGVDNSGSSATVTFPSLSSGTATDQAYVGAGNIANGDNDSVTAGFTDWASDAFTRPIVYNLSLSTSTNYTPSCQQTAAGFNETVAAIFASAPKPLPVGTATFAGQGSTPKATTVVSASPTVTQAIRRAGYY